MPESAAVDGEEPGLRVGSPEYPAPASFYGDTTIKANTQSTSATTGTLTVAGGVGEGKGCMPVHFVYFQLPYKKSAVEFFVGNWIAISQTKFPV